MAAASFLARLMTIRGAAEGARAGISRLSCLSAGCLRSPASPVALFRQETAKITAQTTNNGGWRAYCNLLPRHQGLGATCETTVARGTSGTIAAGASVSGVALQARSMGTAGKSGKKMKSYSSYKKRFKLSKKTGEYTRRRSGSAHLMQKKSKSQKRRLRLSTTTHEGYASVMKRLGFKKTKFC